jgi:hypothetical protein
MNAILEKFVSRPEFCRQLGISVRTAELWAHARKGPAVTIIGRRAYYHVDDIAKYLSQCRGGKAARSAGRRVRR